jgi:uncharacterized protein
MGKSVLVDAGFIVALLNNRDAHHDWAVTQAHNWPPPWGTCEAVLSEAYHLLGDAGALSLGALLHRRALLVSFELRGHTEAVAKLMEKYSDVPMSFADACLVRMTETHANPLILTTDKDFRIYRRHGRQVVPCITPD